MFGVCEMETVDWVRFSCETYLVRDLHGSIGGQLLEIFFFCRRCLALVLLDEGRERG